jgi:hypothetical protein
MTRPSSLTADAEEEILQGLTAGYGGEVAAEAAGIPATTWYGWMRAAREGDPRYQRLLEALTASRRRRRQPAASHRTRGWPPRTFSPGTLARRSP